jgi:hypothetical protein
VKASATSSKDGNELFANEEVGSLLFEVSESGSPTRTLVGISVLFCWVFSREFGNSVD